MKILAPFSKKEEVTPLVEAGADELYCGIVPNDYIKQYLCTLNRRPWNAANFDSFDELNKALRIAHDKGVKVFVTMNSLYIPEQYPLILDIINKIDSDGFIIADIGLLLLLREMNFKKDIHIGTGGTVFNSRTADFYRKLGASRIILPRHLTVNEIETITHRSRGLELETFILYEPCVFVDGFCNFHAPSANNAAASKSMTVKDKDFSFISKELFCTGPGCSLINNPKLILDDKTGRKIGLNNRSFPPLLFNTLACGACAIYDFTKIGVSSVKIVGRGLSAELKIKGTKFIKKILDSLKNNNMTKERFIKNTRQLYCETYEAKKCSGFNCYYPSVFSRKRLSCKI